MTENIKELEATIKDLMDKLKILTDKNKHYKTPECQRRANKRYYDKNKHKFKFQLKRHQKLLTKKQDIHKDISNITSNTIEPIPEDIDDIAFY